MEERILQALYFLEKIHSDPSIPKNVRRAVESAIGELRSRNKSPAHRANSAISILGEISQDPTTPLYVRTLVWQAISVLEQVRD